MASKGRSTVSPGYWIYTLCFSHQFTVDNRLDLNEEGQYAKWAPALVKRGAVLDSIVAPHVKQLHISEGCVYSPLVCSSTQHC